MITFKCPHCGKAVSVADEHAGKTGRCPGCKELFQIPTAGGIAVAHPPTAPAPAAGRRSPPPPAAEEAPRRKKYDPDADEEPRSRAGAKEGRREPDEEEEDEAPRKKKRPRDDDEDEAVAEAPRKKRRPRDDEDEDDRPARRRRARGEEDDDYEEDEEADFPKTVQVAGIAWIGFGCLILVNLVILLLATFVMAADVPKGGPQEAAVGAMFCAALVGGLFGAAFILVGVQSVRGTARDTLGNGIGSLIFGLLNLGGAAAQAGGEHFLQAGIGFLAGLGLIAAGVLALVGRSQYKAWRKTQGPRRRGRDRR